MRSSGYANVLTIRALTAFGLEGFAYIAQSVETVSGMEFVTEEHSRTENQINLG